MRYLILQTQCLDTGRGKVKKSHVVYVTDDAAECKELFDEYRAMPTPDNPKYCRHFEMFTLHRHESLLDDIE